MSKNKRKSTLENEDNLKIEVFSIEGVKNMLDFSSDSNTLKVEGGGVLVA